MINYSIQVVLFQVLFLAVYDLFLHKETFFKWNRFYLLATPFLAFIIPLIKIEIFQKNIAEEYITYLPEVVLNPQTVIEKTINSSNTFNYISIIFFTGVVVFTILFLVKLFKIIRLILANKVIKKETYSLVILKDKKVAFSFFNFIFINEKLLRNNDLQIIQHELIHCKQKHTIDLLVFEILKIVQWFNPLIYLFQQRITVLHEYLSDEEVIQKSNSSTYFNKLLSETFNVENITFINQFYKHSLIKKRIVMITKNKSQKVKQLKYLLIVPLLFAMLIFSSFQNKSIERTINNNLILTDSIIPKNSIPFALIKKVPIYPGCKGTEIELRKCLQENISNYINKNFNADLADHLNLQPGIKRVFVMFSINKEGEIDNVRARAPHKKIKEEAIRVIKLLPKMIPGQYKGKVVNIRYSLPIGIMVNDKQKKAFIVNRTNKFEYKRSNGVPFAVIDKVPVYPGCSGDQATLRKCLQDNIAQFVSANFNSDISKGLGLSSGIKRVFVLFTINKEGNVTGVRARAPHIKLQEEAIRVIKLLPKMIPGKQDGKNVNVKYSLPIAFNVADESPKQKKETLKGITTKNQPIYILEGKEISKKDLNKIDTDKIKSINVLKGKSATKKYGKEGKNGVVEIIMKKKM
ncbi:energy transducer TonB [Lutibacter sp.]|uniref:energy transducer TonB n=1 Tax=Lutibacter sp. TaxID=1925666 RepID=UPI0025C05874|nr:energy transducer TonB [Lutibacter sp.]MCF6182163.1 M56 family metallopeptidase [Lutibacter sp.]